MEQNLFVVVVRIDVIILIYDSGRSVGLHISIIIFTQVVPSVIVANTPQATGLSQDVQL
jgi:hypothetical protein